jgi:arylsulfatase A-like enzyme
MRALMAAGLAAALPLAAAAAPPAPVGRILLVTIDTLRADHLGAYGGPVPTPAIDALAGDGVLLLEACTPTPSTGPAHASLFTGLHPWRHRVLDNAVPLPAELPRLATWMRAAGFSTAAFVSSYIVHERFGFGRGFDVYAFTPTEEYTWRGRPRDRFWTRGQLVVDAAVGWITAHAGERFFVWVHLFDPHSPYDPPDGFRISEDAPVSLEAKRVPPGVRDTSQLSALIRAYRGEVSYADAQVGRLMERLRSLDLLDETAVVVSSDHGEGLGDHGLLEHGANLHDELVRVPLVLRAPGLPRGRRLAGSAQLEDLAPTLLSIAGVAIPPGLDGVDLGPWLGGAAPHSPRAGVLGQRKHYRGRPDRFFLRDWPRKWIGGKGGRGREFRLDEDPLEQGGTVRVGLPEPLRSAVEASGATPAEPPVLDEETRRALEALGYVE